MEPKADIGLIGLGVMGQNLALNMNDHGFGVAVFNRTTSKTDDFLRAAAKGTQVTGAHSIEELIGKLKKPRSMRDYFGAHTYERVDRERGQFFHTDWIDK